MLETLLVPRSYLHEFKWCRKRRTVYLQLSFIISFVFVSRPDVPEAEIRLEMQLQNVEDVSRLNLWCNGEPQHTDQTVLKTCAVKLVDIRKTQGLNSNITSEENLPTGVPGECSMFDGDQETLQAQLKTSSVRLVDYRKAKAEDKSSRFDGDQKTLHTQLKIGLVRLVDCGKFQSRKATAEDKLDDKAYHHDYNIPDKSNRFHGDQQTLHTQLKMSLVRLVDCGKILSRKATAEGKPEGGAYEHENKNSDFISSSKSRQSSSEDEEDKSTSQEQTIKRKTPRKVTFGKSVDALRLSGNRNALCKGRRVYQCSRCSRSFRSSFAFGRHQKVHTEEKHYY
ncbi:zinc finger protein interacting with ribonucleoprotein K isoform X4 [Ictalurus punctatus]|uniref:Zinc finger protein interacting with ribonucleoprotein K isoform X4 n=1 Tax=Ictalurus punctatus TaxID=7998 RepID=A0A9F7TNS1_ICTPU|nr:zinc finger protein interacting with ribonucleoprotein K isoform X4 [Ictalurus punctatus]